MPFSQTRNMPPRQAFNLGAGGTKRKLVRTGESVSLDVTMSKDKLGKWELGPDDDVVMLPGDSPTRSNNTSHAKMPDKATLTRLGDSGSLGITLPKEELEELGIEAGDEVVLLPNDDDPNAFTLYFPPEE